MNISKDLYSIMDIISTIITPFWDTPLSVKLLSLVIVLVIHRWMNKALLKKRYRLPPGPKAWPIVGNLPDISKTTPWGYYKHLHETYGDIVLFQLGMVPTVVISGLKYFTEALVTKGNDFAGRGAIPSWDPLVCDAKDIIMSPRITSQWIAQRKLFHGVMRNFVGGETLQNCIDSGLERFYKVIDATEEGPHYPGKNISRMVVNSMFSLLYGTDFEYEDPLFMKLELNCHRVHNAFLPGILESMFPFTQYFPYLPGRSILKECGQFREQMFRDMIVGKLQDNSWENGKSLIDEILRIKKQSERKEGGYKLQIRDIIAILIDFEHGSTDTTEYTLTWAFLFILTNPAVQERIHTELDNILGDHQLRLDDFDKEHLPYVTAVFRETLRMRLLLPSYLPHVTTCDTTLGAYDIPEGTNILINVDSIHLDKDAWEDPEVFRPERFLDESGQLLPKPDHFVPFAAGRRVCAGEVMGKKMVPYLLACIMQRYKIEPGPGEMLDTTAVIKGSGREPKPYMTIFKKMI